MAATIDMMPSIDEAKLASSLFEATSFVVQADRLAQANLAKDFASVVSSWEDHEQGYNIPVGSVEGRPVHIEVRWARLNGFDVMFYHGASPLVDHELIGDFLDEHVAHRRTGRRCDAPTFHKCIDFVNF